MWTERKGCRHVSWEAALRVESSRQGASARREAGGRGAEGVQGRSTDGRDGVGAGPRRHLDRLSTVWQAVEIVEKR